MCPESEKNDIMALLDAVDSEDEEDLDNLNLTLNLNKKNKVLKNPGIPVVQSLKKKNTIDPPDIKWMKIFPEGVSFVVTTEAIKVFHGIILGMNLMVLPSIKDYWRTDQFGVDWIKTTMPKQSLRTIIRVRARGDVVLSLTSSLKFTYARVFADNYFSSVNSVRQLKERGIYHTATIQKKRKGLPECIPDKELRKTTGSMNAYVNVNAGVGVLKWFDNRVVHIISSTNAYHGTVMVNHRDKGELKKNFKFYALHL
ncbi:unnamed protein product [Lepeophtheirus salmonis]|uniref:(salmon louse) hypothetical protein n=1 Tax=Lepeophtheirus salmonis TaxID=72036 RepID=A0A7R8D405_LEPSM|nr:unnamed protein product [Lepeophtheirus salmonis]CAF3021394.1 unnamed protein product [Lepeophtheirus salmonis]